MKSFIRFLLGIALIGLVPQKLITENLPEYRPALLGQGKQSLVNLINIESLYKRGQRGATIMFSQIDGLVAVNVANTRLNRGS